MNYQQLTGIRVALDIAAVDDMEALGGIDAAFLALETRTTHLHVAAILVLDPPEGKRSLFSPETRFSQVRRLLEERIHLVPVLRQRIVRVPFGLQHPVWVDDPHFDLSNHLRLCTLPDPGGESELNTLIAEIMSSPLAPNQPLWEMTVVDGMIGSRSAIIAKIHHCLVDGVSGATLLGAFLDLGPHQSPGTTPFLSTTVTSNPTPNPTSNPTVLSSKDPTATATTATAEGESESQSESQNESQNESQSAIETWSPKALPSHLAMLRYGIHSLARQPKVSLDALDTSIDALVRVGSKNRLGGAEKRDLPPAPFSGPRTSLNGTLSTQRCFASMSVSLDDVKLIRRAYGTTINDVILAGVGGGIRRLLEKRGEEHKSSMIAMVPVSKRRMAERGIPGNRISGMLVSLGTNLTDPIERLRVVALSSKNAKAQERLTAGKMVSSLAQVTPPILASRISRLASGLRIFDHIPPPFNVTVSSVPGPDFPLWCASSRVSSMFPVGPIAEGTSLNVTSMTYLKGVHFGFFACKTLLPEIDELAIMVQSEIAQLVELAKAH